MTKSPENKALFHFFCTLRDFLTLEGEKPRENVFWGAIMAVFRGLHPLRDPEKDRESRGKSLPGV
jgi:hypothetical protein